MFLLEGWFFTIFYMFPFFYSHMQQANESDVKALHPLATAHRPKNHNKFDAFEGKHTKNALQQLRSMMPSRGKFSIFSLNHNLNWNEI